MNHNQDERRRLETVKAEMISACDRLIATTIEEMHPWNDYVFDDDEPCSIRYFYITHKTLVAKASPCMTILKFKIVL